MVEASACPVCGAALLADAPHGLCPRCLLQCGLNGCDGAETRSTATPYPGSFVAPRPEELAGHFPQLEILAVLGQGGMGAVYKARQTKLDRFVALKILPSAANQDPAFAERFGREARALARLNHPQIVAVHDFGQAGGYFFFVMEYVDGVNLRHVIQTGRMQAVEALRIVPQLCDALQYAHEEGVVHRDIKPENILLDRKGRVKIADFGLAKLLRQTVPAFRLTATHQIMGTPRYMAPEQMEKPQDVDHRADIYSLGVVFYEMLTGELPLGRFAPPSHKADVDIRLDPVILRALAKEPERRYQHVSEVSAAVLAVVRARCDPNEAAGDGAPGVRSSSVFFLMGRFTVRFFGIGHAGMAPPTAYRLAAWTALCVALYVVLWFPVQSAPNGFPSFVGLIDRRLWPYQFISKSTVNLLPKSEAYARAVLVEHQVIDQFGFDHPWPDRTEDAAVPPGCRLWTISGTLGDGGNTQTWSLDLMTLDFRSSGDGSRRLGPVDRGDILSLMNDYRRRKARPGEFPDVPNTVNTVIRDQLIREASEIVALMQKIQERRGGVVLEARASTGRLDYLVRLRKEAVKPYPFVEHIAADTRQVASVGYVSAVGIPVSVLIWLLGLVGLMSRGRDRRQAVALAQSRRNQRRGWLGNVLTYFWSQPRGRLSSDEREVPPPLPCDYPIRRGEPKADLASPPAALVRGPAIGLLLCGILQLLFQLVWLAFFIPDSGDERFTFTLYCTLVMVAGMGMVTGAVQLLWLRSRFWAWIAAVMALLPLTPFWLIGAPFGFWTMRVLEMPEVIAALDRQ